MSAAFWKPGTTGPGSTVDRASEIEGGAILSSAPVGIGQLSLQAQRERLPIFKHRDELLYCVERFGVTIVVAETGSGKTTQLPQYLYEAGWASKGNVVACTQPRRVAATSVATRVAQEVGSVLGDEVGYTIRFEDVSDKERTRIKYLTDGMLFRETLVDPLLSKYSVIMIDEAHERSLYTDLLLGILKKIRRKRPSLRLIISSATLDASHFLKFFNANNQPNEAIVLSIKGRAYPVEIAYLKEPCADYVKEAVRVIWDLHKRGDTASGDALIFMTGREDIERCLWEFSELLPNLPDRSARLNVLPLHAGLSTADQLAIFHPSSPSSRKVVVATNIAEASVTIDGVKWVVDCGFVKIRTFNSTTSLSTLLTTPISRASAIQRAGRAGRTSPGACYRLYTESSFEGFPVAGIPEVQRSDMTLPILQLKALGIDDIMKFEWISAPSSEAIIRALERLVRSGMIGEEDGRLVEVGTKVAEFGVDIGIASMLWKSKEMKCSEEILTIAAMVSVQDVFIIPDGAAGAIAELERRKFTAEEGDHLTLLNAFNGFVRYGSSSRFCGQHAMNFRALSRAVNVRAQLRRYMQRFGIWPLESCEGDGKRLRKCLVSGYADAGNIGKWAADGTYRTLRGDKVLHVHPTSVLFTRKPKSGWVVFHEVEETKKTHIRILTEIEPEWLLEFGHKHA